MDAKPGVSIVHVHLTTDTWAKQTGAKPVTGMLCSEACAFEPELWEITCTKRGSTFDNANESTGVCCSEAPKL